MSFVVIYYSIMESISQGPDIKSVLRQSIKINVNVKKNLIRNMFCYLRCHDLCKTSTIGKASDRMRALFIFSFSDQGWKRILGTKHIRAAADAHEPGL